MKVSVRNAFESLPHCPPPDTIDKAPGNASSIGIVPGSGQAGPPTLSTSSSRERKSVRNRRDNLLCFAHARCLNPYDT